MTSMYPVLAALVLLLLATSASGGPTPVSAAVNPTIATIAPATGPVSGGTPVTITGTGFLPGAAVYFGGVPATSVVVVSSTQITATTPAGTQGSANLLVVNTDGGAGTATALYFFSANTTAISLSGTTPSNGPVGGDTLITITGSGFAPGATVLMGGIPATAVQWIGSSQLWARTPPNAAGSVAMTVLNPDGGSVTLSNAFTYAGGVTVTSASPSGGLTTGSATVLITGSGFASGASVRFGASSATSVTFVNSTQLLATTPASPAGTVAITVTNPNGSTHSLSNAFTFNTAAGGPTVTTVTPATGLTSGGITVTITGTGFTGGSTVLFGGASSPAVTFLSSGQLFAVTPANNPGATTITVINSSGGAGTLANAFVYTGASGLGVTSITPSAGPVGGGTTVTISGSGFASGTTVQFGGVPAASTTVVGGSQLVATTAPGTAGAATVTVTNIGGLSAVLPNGFTFGTSITGQVGPLIVTSVTPNAGPTGGGTTVTINGSGFLPGASVLFGLIPATGVTIVSNSQITATSPANAGAQSVTVTNPGGIAGVLSAAFTYGGTSSSTAPPSQPASPAPVPGTVNLPPRGFGLFVFAGGTSEQLLTASGCPAATAAFYATATGEFVVYVPGTSIGAVNAAWRALFPAALPANTPLIGRCA